MEETLMTLMVLERTKKIIRKTIRRWWMMAVFVALVITILSLITVIIIGNAGLMYKAILGVIALAILILILLTLAFRVHLKSP